MKEILLKKVDEGVEVSIANTEAVAEKERLRQIFLKYEEERIR